MYFLCEMFTNAYTLFIKNVLDFEQIQILIFGYRITRIKSRASRVYGLTMP